MRLHSLRLQNFRQHEESVIEFGTGITGIIGPNGAGKTTILEAIAWALYGTDAARGKRDSIKFQRAQPRAVVRVELDFDLGGHRYRVVRGLTTAELYLDGGAMPVANSISAVNEFVQHRIGMSRTEFFNTYFTGQKELGVMAALGPTERGMFLSRVLGYERLRSAQDLVRTRRRELAAELAGVEQGLPDAEAVQQAMADAVAEQRATAEAVARARARSEALAVEVQLLTAQWEIAQAEQRAHLAAESDLRMREAELAERGRDVVRLREALTEATTAAAQCDELRTELAPLAGLVAERERLDALAVSEGRRTALQQVIATDADDIARRRERAERLADAPNAEGRFVAERDAARDALDAISQQAENAHTDWIRDRQEAETKRDALRVQYAELRDQRERVVDAGETGLCPTCQRPLGAGYRALLDTLDQQLDVMKVDGGYWRARCEQLAERPAHVAALEEQRREQQAALTLIEVRLERTRSALKEREDLGKELARLEARIAGARADLASLPVGYDAARHDVVRRELERLTPLERSLARLSAAAELVGTLSAQLAAVETVVSTLEQTVDALRTRVSVSAAQQPAWTTLHQAVDAAGREANAAALTLAAAAAAHAAAETAVARARLDAESRAKAEARRVALARTRRMHDELDAAYAGLRTDLNLAMRPELSELASRFLTILTDGRYAEFELDDQYALVIVEDGLPKPVISGGEEDLANLVLRLAISQMIAERAGQSFSLLILDEIFGSLDEVRRQNVVELLRRLHDRFEQVILITHIESVRDGCDQVLSVRYDARSGAARVTAGDPTDAVLAEVSP